MRVTRMIGAVAVAVVLVVLGFTGSAWAPPAVGETGFSASPKCVPLGGRIIVAGSGFAPGSAVSVSARFTNSYQGPPSLALSVRSRTFPVDASGQFAGHLNAFKGYPDSQDSVYFAMAVFANGKPQLGSYGPTVQMFSTTIIASPKICKYLAASD